jgi:hypothetical protein
LYVFHVESAIEAFTNEPISVVKVSRDGLVFIFKENGRKNAGQNYGKKWTFLRTLHFSSYFRLSLHCVSGGNKKIIFNIDNQSVVHIINKKSSKSVRVMSLVRHLVLSTLQYNIMIKALHISGISNKIADSLSRCDWQRFRNLCPEADQRGTEIPDHLWKL